MRVQKSKKNYRIFVIFFVFVPSLLFGFSKNRGLPYEISYEFDNEPSDEYESAGLRYRIFNSSEKEILDFTVVFFLFDEEGNSVLSQMNYAEVIQNKAVDARTWAEGVISLDDYLSYTPETTYDVEYLFLSSITYSDGTVWTDTFGTAAF